MTRKAGATNAITSVVLRSPLMIIINADDLGRSRAETDAVLDCYGQGRITSTSAMVFMTDSARAAELAKASKIDVGLHLNLSERLTAEDVPSSLRECHESVVRFLTAHKYAVVLYNQMLTEAFRYAYTAQVDEFCRLYGRRPSHIDGHQHKHLCSNILLRGIIPAGEKVRRGFSYWRGEKSGLKRFYRQILDTRLKRRYLVTDFFFSLSECLETHRIPRVFELAHSFNVELMTHPAKKREYDYLMSQGYRAALSQLRMGTYASPDLAR